MSKLFCLPGLEQFGCPAELYILAEDKIEVLSKLEEYFKENYNPKDYILSMDTCKELIERGYLKECTDVVLVDIGG